MALKSPDKQNIESTYKNNSLMIHIDIIAVLAQVEKEWHKNPPDCKILILVQWTTAPKKSIREKIQQFRIRTHMEYYFRTFKFDSFSESQKVGFVDLEV